ncbi:HTH-type transcriptional regulator / antitoxin HigA [Raineyella antarctica]|uniref:HTH-type transcriptional regulator / antitoxin HigA n=1 Tax=Raineyella antarctica TaxID=1577474 RepID=A0A1G6GD58_9ACTN|nr:ImmA/IrrE family metallo-endopeptidase [Raineyella antarctica]SDB79904.1 HTH-type transcriptional regulator / antitoxin HigA [Raineyella antarctica]
MDGTDDAYEVEPDFAVPTGDYVDEWLEDHHMRPAELARRTGVSPKHISKVLGGAAVTADFAARLELVTGVPADRWLALESTYRAEVARLGLQERFAHRTDILDLFQPSVTYLRKRGAITVDRRKPGQLMLQLMAFFRVADPDALLQPRNHLVPAFHRSGAFQVNDASVYTWLQAAELQRQNQPPAPAYDRPALEKSLPRLRILSRELVDDPTAFIRVLAGVGVQVILQPEVPGCRAYGATYWRDGTPVIVLSARGKKDGIIWFTLFHELGHVLLHPNHEFVEQSDGEEAIDAREAAANSFAEETLIPRSCRSELPGLRSKKDVIEFAQEIGVSPGVVLQHLRHHQYPHWPPRNGADLFVTVTIAEDESA